MLPRQKYFYWLMALLFVSTAACKKKYEDNYFKDYFPLEIGNTWVYQHRYYVPADQNNWADTTDITIQILKDTILDQNIRAYVVEETRTTNGHTNSNNYLWYVNDQQFIFDNYLSPYRSPQTVYSIDLEVGMSWRVYPQSLNTSAYTTRSVIEELSNYALFNQNVQAFSIVSGDSIGINSGYLRTEELFAPYIGKISETRYERVYGRIHIQETKLINYFKK